MKNRNSYAFALLFLSAFLLEAGNSSDFFTIKSVRFFDKPPHRGFALYQEIIKPDNKTREQIFLPFLKVTVQTSEEIRAETLYAKAYYYDKSCKLIEKTDKPHPVKRGSQEPYPMPVFFRKSQTETLYFAVPDKVLKMPKWQAVVIFGDEYAAAATVYPRGGRVTSFGFPERSKVDKPERIEREAIRDPVIEYVVKTRNKEQPQITLFMRPPVGMTDVSEAKGVLAMCLLANKIGEIKRRLEELEAGDDVGGLLRFAEKHKLVILCWGSRSLWDPRASWDEQSKQLNRQMDKTFDDVADAWAKGVEKLSRKYGIPDKGFLLWGISGSAQYAKRLALRKPQYFLAVHIHIPSSFDKPTPEANHVLWCLTTGENELGYQRSLRFFSACQELGYPIIYKAIISLGHSGHPTAEKLGLDFFEYALTLREERSKFETEMSKSRSKTGKKGRQNSNQPWPKSFRNPEFVGDIVNQEIFPFEEADMVPANFRTMLPTPKLAESWNDQE